MTRHTPVARVCHVVGKKPPESEGDYAMKKIAVVSMKGGCGKTTTAVNLAASLGELGEKTLLVDFDPQAHATLSLDRHCADELGLYEVFTDRVEIRDVIIPEVSGIDLIPSTKMMMQAEELLSDWPRERELELKLNMLGSEYDYVVIDSPPVNGLLMKNAILAADAVIVPIEMSSFGVSSVEKLIELFHELEQRHGAGIDYHILPTMVDSRTRLARKFLRTIWENFPDQVLPLIVHQTVRVREAACNGVPVHTYASDSPASDDYRQLARHLPKCFTGHAQDIFVPSLPEPEHVVQREPLPA